tara:strand:+ start:46 stop:756 length:711 start_codon:yes stop_codon:yes gene_type:complete
MTDGFKDKDGKFRPTVWSPKKNGIKKGSIDSSTTSNNTKYKLQEYYHFDDLSESAKEKALEDARISFADGYNNDFIDYDGQIYDSNVKPHFDGNDVFKEIRPVSYEIDGNRGNDYVQYDLDFKEGGEKRLMKYLGIPKSLQDKISIGFRNSNDNYIYKHNTDIVFFDDDGMEYITYGNTDDKTYQVLHNAEEKWYNLMDNALDGLVQNAQYQYSDEAMKENIEANEWQFDKEGNVV